MKTESAILEIIQQLPEPIKQSVLLYSKFLASQYQENPTIQPDQQSQRPSLLGCMKGTFVLPLPNDFDEPLESFEDYM